MLLTAMPVHIIGNKSYNISRGQYFFVDYHTVHSYKSLSGTIEVINCRFKPQFLDNSFESCRSFRTLLNHYLLKVRVENLRMNPSGVMFFDDDGSIGAYMKKMRTEYENKLPGYLEMMRCTLIEIILSTMRRISDVGFDSDAIQVLADYAAKTMLAPAAFRAFQAVRIQYAVFRDASKQRPAWASRNILSRSA